jgi:hypothetical protein
VYLSVVTWLLIGPVRSCLRLKVSGGTGSAAGYASSSGQNMAKAAEFGQSRMDYPWPTYVMRRDESTQDA